MTSPNTAAYYSRIRHPTPNASKYVPPHAKRTSKISLPFVTILANHPGYVVRGTSTAPVLKSCKIPKTEL